MKVLVVGSGGREHALCWAIRRSPSCDALYCAPGNPGIEKVADCVPVDASDIEGLLALAQDKMIDLVVVGPEAPLTAGLVDRLENAGIAAFGPNAAAAVLEGSKGFMKDIAAKYGIPSAWYRRFTDVSEAKMFIREKGVPIVIKADGLAAGKGVILAQTEAEAIEAVEQIMESKVFGTAGDEVVIEEFLYGEEVSFFAITDGKTAVPLAAAQDHKAVGDGDTGPNTGGMGAYSPTPVVTPAMQEDIMTSIILPTVRGMAAEGRPFKGVLFAGIMVTDGRPRLLEFNVRFGDPECQVLMMRAKSDILPVLAAAAKGSLDQMSMEWDERTALVVVMAARGYPGVYEKGSKIGGLDAAGSEDGVHVFHAGTARAADGSIIATGGRVLGVTAVGDSVSDAQARAYRAVERLQWPEGFCRRDIGWRAVARERN